MSRTSLPIAERWSSSNVLADLQVFLCCLFRRQYLSRTAETCAIRSVSDAEAGPRDPDSRPSSSRTRSGCERVAEEDGTERNRARAGGDEVERIPSRRDPAHAHDRQLDGVRAGVDAGESDRPERRPGRPAGTESEPRPETARGRGRDREACSRARARPLPRPRRPAPAPRCRRSPARASRTAACPSPRVRPVRARRSSPALRRRWDTRDSARRPRSRRARRCARSRSGSRRPRTRPRRPRAAPRARAGGERRRCRTRRFPGSGDRSSSASNRPSR